METVGQEQVTPANGGLVGAGKEFLEKIKTPVFWFAIGYVTALLVSKKKKYVKV